MPRKWRFTPEERALRAIQRMSLGGHMESSAPVKGGLSKESLALAAGAASAIDQVPWQEFLGGVPGTVVLTSGKPGVERHYMGFDGSVGWARASLDSPATGTTIVDIYKNGSTIFTTPTHRPALASGQNSVLASGIDVPAFVAGDYFTFDVVQLGSSPGADLTVQIGGLPILGDPAAVGSANYREVVLADSPLAYWRLGESSGTSAVDETGNGHTATYHGSPTLGATGALAGDANTAVTFDGVNDYVDCAIDLSAQNQLTIECWLKVSSFADNDHLLCEYTPNFNTDNVGGFIANPNSSSDSKFDLGMHSNSSNYVLRNFTRPSTGAFHHLVLRYDRIATPDATVNAVVDGTVVTMGGLSTTPLGDNFGNSTLYIMSRAGASLFLAGTLDEFAIYGGLLSDARALAHYNAGIGA